MVARSLVRELGELVRGGVVEGVTDVPPWHVGNPVLYLLAIKGIHESLAIAFYAATFLNQAFIHSLPSARLLLPFASSLFKTRRRGLESLCGSLCCSV